MTPTNKEASPDAAKAPSDTDSSGEPIFTPPDSEARFAATTFAEPSKRGTSSSPLRLSSFPPDHQDEIGPDNQTELVDWSEEEAPNSDLGLDEDEMAASRPPLHRPTDGWSEQPLLKDEGRGRSDFEIPNGSARPARRSTFRSRSPSYVDPENTTRRKYIYAAFFLVLSLISFVIQTETAVYIQHTLGWKKAYCMLWLTHGSWSLLWPAQLLILRIQKRKLSWLAFWRRHKYLVRTTAQMVQHQELHLTTSSIHQSPVPYILRTTVVVSSALTIAGASWYVAVDLTTPSDLTAIYNCSAFFAYVFSIMLLNDKLRLDKAVAVTIAIAGVLVVAYGDTKEPKHAGPHGGASGGGPQEDNEKAEGASRTVGNLVIGIGSVLYGLYEVLYKKWACPPEGTSPGRGMIFANTFGSLIGLFTLTVLWIPIPILHFTGLEPFELPRGKAAGLLFISTISNAVFSGSFLVLMSLTSPVLSSVAALLTIFLVAITDSLLHPEESLSAAAIGGGSMIIVAFAMLSWATYREMDQERKKREADEGVLSDDED
jgi:drug/metabolite transporter (DMT)-like permease